MSHGTFRQVDMERIIRAAKAEGAAVTIDLRTLVVTVIPDIHRVEILDGAPDKARILPVGNLAPDGKDNF